MLNLILAASDRYTETQIIWMNIGKTTCFVLLILASLVLVAGVMVNASNSEGSSALTGSVNESYYGKNKGKNAEGKLRLMIIISACLILVCSIGLILLLK